MHHRLSGKLFAMDDLQPGTALHSAGRIMIAGFTQTAVFGHYSHSFYPSVTSNSEQYSLAKDVPETSRNEEIFTANVCSHLNRLWICFSNSWNPFSRRIGIIYLHWHRM